MPTDARIVELFKGLVAELKAELTTLSIERRYMPYIDGSELTETKVSVFIETTEDGYLGRSNVETQIVTFGVSVQQVVASPTVNDANSEPVMDGVDNLSHGDDVLNIVENIKDLWRTEGNLRDKLIGSFRFKEMIHDPVYEPLHLMQFGIFTAIIDVTYELTEG